MFWPMTGVKLDILVWSAVPGPQNHSVAMESTLALRSEAGAIKMVSLEDSLEVSADAAAYV